MCCQMYWCPVHPSGIGAFGFSTLGTNNSKISVCPFSAAECIGVYPTGIGALGFLTLGTDNLKISVCPFSAAK